MIKDALLARHPWLAQSVYAAFLQAKNEYVERLKAGHVTTANDRKYAGFMPLLGDPLPYGVKDNLPSIKTMIDYTYQQGMIPKQVTPEEVFVKL